jgi:hypothetical protein
MPRNFATLGPSSYSRRLLGFRVRAKWPFPLILQHWAASASIHLFSNSQRPVIAIGRFSRTFPRFKPYVTVSRHTAWASSHRGIPEFYLIILCSLHTAFKCPFLEYIICWWQVLCKNNKFESLSEPRSFLGRIWGTFRSSCILSLKIPPHTGQIPFCFFRRLIRYLPKRIFLLEPLAILFSKYVEFSGSKEFNPLQTMCLVTITSWIWNNLIVISNSYNNLWQ